METQYRHEEFVEAYGYGWKGNLDHKSNLFVQESKDKGTKATFFLNEGHNALIYTFNGRGTILYKDWKKANGIIETSIKVTKVQPKPEKYLMFADSDLSNNISTLEQYIVDQKPELASSIRSSFEKYVVVDYDGYTCFLKKPTKHHFESGKLVKYSGLKRVKGKFTNTSLRAKGKKLGLFQTDLNPALFFGYHLVNSKSKVVIVESEKTAILLDIFFSEYKMVFIATGSLSTYGRVLKSLKDMGVKRVFALPDRQGFIRWLNLSLKYDLGKVSAMCDNTLNDKDDIGDILEGWIQGHGDYYTQEFEEIANRTIQEFAYGIMKSNVFSKLNYNDQIFYASHRFDKRVKDNPYIPSYIFNKDSYPFFRTQRIPIGDKPNYVCSTDLMDGFDNEFPVISPKFNVAKTVDEETLVDNIETVVKKVRYNIVELLKSPKSYFDANLDYVVGDIISTIQNYGIITNWHPIISKIKSSDLDAHVDELISLRNWEIKKDQTVDNKTNIMIEISKIKAKIINTLLAGNMGEALNNHSFIKGHPIDHKSFVKRSGAKDSLVNEFISVVNEYNTVLFGSKVYNTCISVFEARNEMKNNLEASYRSLKNKYGLSNSVIEKAKRALPSQESIDVFYNSVIKAAEKLASY